MSISSALFCSVAFLGGSMVMNPMLCSWILTEGVGMGCLSGYLSVASYYEVTCLFVEVGFKSVMIMIDGWRVC
jgi:hypothetical protein